MNRHYINILSIFFVSQLINCIVQWFLMKDSSGWMPGFGLAVLVTIVAAVLIRLEFRKRDRTLLRLIRASAEDGELDRSMIRPGDPVDEAVCRAHTASLERYHWYESILNTIPFGISVTDMEMRWTFCNDAALASMNKKAGECLGRHCSEKGGNLCNTPDCGIEQLRRGVTRLTNTLPSGRTMLLDLHYLLDRAGNRIGHVEVSKDITEETALRREAREASRRGRQEIVQRLSAAGEKLRDAASTLMGEIGQVKEQTVQASSRLVETATAMEEMNSTVLEVAKNAEDAAHASLTVHNEAETGARAMERTVSGMQSVQARSLGLKEDMLSLDVQARGIGEILTIIRDIADQTNLLALNAAIEAARAGDAGRGFAVVADEVRKLAEKTMSATHKVDEAVGAIQTGTDSSAQTVQDAVEAIDEVTGQAQQSGEALVHIAGLANDSSSQVQAIAAAATEQSAASEEINRNVADISKLSHNITQSMEVAAEEVTEILRQAQSIYDVLESIRGELERDNADAQAGTDMAN